MKKYGFGLQFIDFGRNDPRLSDLARDNLSALKNANISVSTTSIH